MSQHKGAPMGMPPSGRTQGNGIARAARPTRGPRNQQRERGIGNTDDMRSCELLAGTGEAPQIRRNRGNQSRGIQRDAAEGHHMFPDNWVNQGCIDPDVSN